jgi:hypothetical protein
LTKAATVKFTVKRFSLVQDFVESKLFQLQTRAFGFYCDQDPKLKNVSADVTFEKEISICLKKFLYKRDLCKSIFYLLKNIRYCHEYWMISDLVKSNYLCYISKYL